MSNQLYFASVDPTGTTITVPHYAASMQYPTRDQVKYKPTLDGKINIQRRITDDREIKFIFESVKEREQICKGTVISGTLQADEFSTSLSAYASGSFNGYYLKFDDDTTTVAIRDGEIVVDDFVKTAGVISFASSFASAPQAGDTFTIYRLASWVDTLKAQRYVLSDLEFTLTVESGNDFDYLPESSTVIILDVQDDEPTATSVKQVIKRVTVVLRKVPS